MDGERTTFLARVTGNSLQRSKQQGTPSVCIRFRTAYNVEEPEVPVRFNIIHNLWLTYKCTERTVKELQEVFGWEGHDIAEFNEPILVGKSCNLVCETEEWEGQERWRVVFLNRAGGFKRLSGADLTALVKEVQPMVDEIVGEKPEIGPESQFSEGNNGGLTEEESYPSEDDLPF